MVMFQLYVLLSTGLDRIFQLPGHLEGWVCVYALSSSNHNDKGGQLKTLYPDKFDDIPFMCKRQFSVAKKMEK